ncbi:MAG: GPW/gp25 family protein [Rhizobiaceae bacterium]|nr:GPW/gp25 family protein [Rhizobiaceae bacterium]
MSGIDRHTGKIIDNFASAVQGIEVILSTRIGSRVLRREFGGGIAELLGRLLTANLFAAFQQLIATAIDLWEPRFHVRRISATGSVDDIRLGKAGLVIEVDYRPLGHLGDFTVESVRSIALRGNGLQVVS